uniref:Uncharacterized protein n=1 Tax=Bracon brevicornis TaxID=1563983 RepID=A0A6V7HWF1_9HYME
MSTAKNTNPPHHRPSSPRRFFARLYGHLETKEEVEKIVKTKGTDATDKKLSPEDLSIVGEKKKRSFEDNERAESDCLLNRSDNISLPLLPYGFFHGGHGLHPYHLGPGGHSATTAAVAAAAAAAVVPFSSHHIPGVHPAPPESAGHFHGFSAFRKTFSTFI